jgi:hypothetical protein
MSQNIVTEVADDVGEKTDITSYESLVVEPTDECREVLHESNNYTEGQRKPATVVRMDVDCSGAE